MLKRDVAVPLRSKLGLNEIRSWSFVQFCCDFSGYLQSWSGSGSGCPLVWVRSRLVPSGLQRYLCHWAAANGHHDSCLYLHPDTSSFQSAPSLTRDGSVPKIEPGCKRSTQRLRCQRPGRGGGTVAVQSSQTPHSYESVNRQEAARRPLGVEAQAVCPGSAGDWLFFFFAEEPAACCHHWFQKTTSSTSSKPHCDQGSSLLLCLLETVECNEQDLLSAFIRCQAATARRRPQC